MSRGPARPAGPPPEQPAAFRGLDRYLLPTERRIVATRRHGAALAEPALTAAAVLVALLTLDAVLPTGVPLVRDVLLAGWALVTGRLAWRAVQWREDWFVVTDRRLLLRSGVLTRRVAMMPLVKVTDMSYDRPLAGRLLGYGEIVIESAGQDQALHRVRFLPRPDDLYGVVCELLFGPQAPTPGAHLWRR